MERSQTRNRPSERVIRRAGDQAGDGATHQEPGKQLLNRLGWASALFVASMIVSVAVSSCGSSEPTRQVSQAEPADAGHHDSFYVPDRIEEPASDAVLATDVGVADESADKQAGEIAKTGSMESWPPELVVSISDTLVTPGEVVEVVAEATDDVVEVALWDGIGQKEPFYFDAAAGVWRTTYRAPLKPHFERTGLSITAKNDAGRWRRLWVFVRAESVNEAVPGELASELEPMEKLEPVEEPENLEASGEEGPDGEPDGS